MEERCGCSTPGSGAGRWSGWGKIPSPMSLRVTMLGSGTSTGIPVIGCPCRVCNSENPKNKRWRPGLKLEMDGGVVLVDTPTDLRAQALRFGLPRVDALVYTHSPPALRAQARGFGQPRVDAIVYTHSHADHIFGLDDVRIFNFRQGTSIPCYGSAETLRALRRAFAYVFEPGQEGGGKAQLDLIEGREPFELLGRRFTPIP